jgi:hypothetical protein|tara:strand:+ start:122 stop:457 length:336 start_codon:yes stop_codon:yes gene_type:complete
MQGEKIMSSFGPNDFYITISVPTIARWPGHVPDRGIVPVETVLTKPFRENSAKYTLFKWKSILGMRGLELKRYGNGREYRSMLKEQSKRRKKARDLTIGEVAEIIEQVEKL